MKNHQLPKKTFCFGTQYYRMVPKPEDWKKDIAAIREMGMDVIRFWALWKWAEPVPGKFYFDDLHRLIQLAQKEGLDVILVLEMDKTPQWVKEQVQDYHLINLDGVPDKNEWSYVNWDHPVIRKLGERFATEVAREFRQYDNVLFDVWNEPDKPEDISCYSRAKFFNWLKEKYPSLQDMITALRLPGYESWDQVPMPGSTWDTGLYLLYQEFRTWSIADQIGWVYDVVKNEAPDHPVTVHVHCDEHPFTFRWFGGQSEVGWDDWEMCRKVDFYITAVHEFYQGEGVYSRLENIGSTIANLETKRTITGGQYWATGLAGGASKGGWPEITGIRPRENMFSLWTCVAHEARGVVYWQYRFERLLAPEIPGWGLVGFDGSPTVRSEESRRFIAALRPYEAEIMSASLAPPKVAILYSLKSHIMNETQPQLDYISAFEGAAFALWIRNIPFNVVNEKDTLKSCNTLIVPMSQCLEDATLERLKAFVQKGGTLVLEAACGAFDERGLLNTSIPGGEDFSTFAGYHEQDVLFEKVFTMHTRHGDLEGVTERRLFESGKDTKAIASWPDGAAAAIEKKCGKGKVLYFSTNVLSAIRQNSKGPEQASIFTRLIGLKPVIQVTGSDRVTCRVLEHPKAEFVFTFNHSSEPSEAEITLPFETDQARAVFMEDCTFNVAGKKIQATLPGRGVLVLRIAR